MPSNVGLFAHSLYVYFLVFAHSFKDDVGSILGVPKEHRSVNRKSNWLGLYFIVIVFVFINTSLTFVLYICIYTARYTVPYHTEHISKFRYGAKFQSLSSSIIYADRSCIGWF